MTTVSPPSMPPHYTDRRSPSEPDQGPPPRGFAYQPVAYQGAGGWDPYTGEWVQGDIFPLGPGGQYYAENEDQASDSPPPSNGGQIVARFKEGYVEGGRKKRKLATDDDDDYQPPGQKRVSRFPLIPDMVLMSHSCSLRDVTLPAHGNSTAKHLSQMEPRTSRKSTSTPSKRRKTRD